MKQPVDWEIRESKLFREFKFKDFKEALSFINKIGYLAEKLDHHPNIFNSYNIVKIELWTHSKNKITEKDYELADKINSLRKHI